MVKPLTAMLMSTGIRWFVFYEVDLEIWETAINRLERPPSRSNEGGLSHTANIVMRGEKIKTLK